MSIVTIVGAGVMGSAMSVPLRDNGHEVRLVGTMLDDEIIDSVKTDGWHPNLKRRLPDGIKAYKLDGLNEALADAELVIGGVSSYGVDWFSKEILPVLPNQLPVLSITKGMIHEEGRLVPYPIIYEQRVPGGIYCAVGGPCTSYELADKDQTHVCFCGKDIESLKKMKSLLQTSYYHISISNDVVGVECAVAMKNAYALGVTLAVGLSEKRDGILHYNSQAALFGQSIREMKKLLSIAGGEENSIVWGAGDLYVTVFGGRTRKLGTLLGKGLSFSQAIEELSGVTLESVVIASRTTEAVQYLIQQGKAYERDFPLLLHIGSIINGQSEVNIPWDDFTEINIVK